VGGGLRDPCRIDVFVFYQTLGTFIVPFRTFDFSSGGGDIGMEGRVKIVMRRSYQVESKTTPNTSIRGHVNRLHACEGICTYSARPEQVCHDRKHKAQVQSKLTYGERGLCLHMQGSHINLQLTPRTNPCRRYALQMQMHRLYHI
jgi:hypothetical protein